MTDLHRMAMEAREAFYQLSVSSAEKRNAFLAALADELRSSAEAVFAANQQDLRDAEVSGLPLPLLHRLRFDESKLEQAVSGLESLQSLPDPIGKTTLATEIARGMNLYRVTCPIGVIGVIFESRPDALVQIASLCMKSGNAVLLKGGSEAAKTNRALTECIRKALIKVGFHPQTVQLLTSREEVTAMLKEDQLIDLIIPRGSNAFVRFIMDHSRIPVLGHADGICHVYIDDAADLQMAVDVAVDSKAQNVSVCNAMETLLIHEKIAPAVLRTLKERFDACGVSLRGDEQVRRIISCEPATDEDWSKEYLDYMLSIRVVSSLEEAIDHINHYGSHHTDCIVTNHQGHAEEFLRRVDSAGVYWNVSTRFADGFVYGFGAEVGISTGKIHARGPMGLEGLTTYKYKLIGSGQTMTDVKKHLISYTHIPLDLPRSDLP